MFRKRSFLTVFTALLVGAMIAYMLFVAASGRHDDAAPAASTRERSADFGTADALTAPVNPKGSLTPQASATPQTLATPLTTEELIAKVRPSIVAIGGTDGHGGKGAATGIIVSEDGLVVTSRHVVQRQDTTFTATLHDGRTQPLTPVDVDLWSDIAFVRLPQIPACRYPALALAPSVPRDGASVLVMGNAFGRGIRASVGIISARAHKLCDGDGPDHGHSYDLVQTDTSVNPGNSGGPVLDREGRVLGVVSRKEMRGETMNHAVSVEDLRSALRSWERFGEIRRGHLGIGLEQVELHESGHGTDVAVRVASVTPGDAADRAGIKFEDRIIAFNGTAVGHTGFEDLLVAVRRSLPGETIRLTLLRGSEKLELAVPVDAADAVPEQVAESPAQGPMPPPGAQPGQRPPAMPAAMAPDSPEAIALARCLTKKGFVLYTAWWCGPCKIQRALFGEKAYQHLKIVQCSAPGTMEFGPQCAGMGTPTWVSKQRGMTLRGGRPLPTLAAIAGCAK